MLQRRDRCFFSFGNLAPPKCLELCLWNVLEFPRSVLLSHVLADLGDVPTSQFGILCQEIAGLLIDFLMSFGEPFAQFWGDTLNIKVAARMVDDLDRKSTRLKSSHRCISY